MLRFVSQGSNAMFHRYRMVLVVLVASVLSDDGQRFAGPSVNVFNMPNGEASLQFVTVGKPRQRRRQHGCYGSVGLYVYRWANTM